MKRREKAHHKAEDERAQQEERDAIQERLAA